MSIKFFGKKRLNFFLALAGLAELGDDLHLPRAQELVVRELEHQEPRVERRALRHIPRDGAADGQGAGGAVACLARGALF